MVREMLDVRNLCVSYTAAKPVLNNVSFQIGSGEILGLVGESGSGKSTILRAILGLLPRQGKVNGGSIDFAGKNLLALGKSEWAQIRGTEISIVFQDSSSTLNPIRTIGSQFAEYIRAHRDLSRQDAWGLGIEMLQKMRLADPKATMACYPFQLSGGMRQRVGIAMAMTFAPKLLLADEATSALDATTQAQIVRQLMELRDNCGTSIIMVTHNLGLAAYMSDQMLVLKDGKIADQGTRTEVLGNPKHPYTKEMIATSPTLKGEIYV